MAAPRLMQKSSVRVSDVDDSRRLRPVTEAGVASLIASVEETGVMKDAIHVRQKKDGTLVLIAGGHRLEMARRLGWEEIEAKVWADVTDDWARLMEIDDNLAGAEMNALDTAVFLAERKRVYEKLHPETKAGVAGAKARWDATEPSSVAFVTATAEKFGLSDRQVRKIAAAGSALEPEEVGLLRTAPRPVTLKDLTELSRINDLVERRQVVLKVHGGHDKSVSAARKSLATAGGRSSDTPKDVAVSKLIDVWDRASKDVRLRFLQARGEEVGLHIEDLGNLGGAHD